MNIRHGDLCLSAIKKLSKGLEESKTKILMIGSGNNPHTFNEGKFYLKNMDKFIIGYFEATSKTKLFHIEHGKKIKGKKLRETKINKGIYEVRRQCEETVDELKKVID